VGALERFEEDERLRALLRWCVCMMHVCNWTA